RRACMRTEPRRTRHLPRFNEGKQGLRALSELLLRASGVQGSERRAAHRPERFGSHPTAPPKGPSVVRHADPHCISISAAQASLVNTGAGERTYAGQVFSDGVSIRNPNDPIVF